MKKFHKFQILLLVINVNGMHCFLFYSGGITPTKVNLKTFSYGNEISWKISQTCSSNQAYYSNSEYSQTCNLAAGEYTLQCLDSFGDGWHRGYIEIQGKKYCKTLTGKSMNATVPIFGISITTVSILKSSLDSLNHTLIM